MALLEKLRSLRVEAGGTGCEFTGGVLGARLHLEGCETVENFGAPLSSWRQTALLIQSGVQGLKHVRVRGKQSSPTPSTHPLRPLTAPACPCAGFGPCSRAPAPRAGKGTSMAVAATGEGLGCYARSFVLLQRAWPTLPCWPSLA